MIIYINECTPFLLLIRVGILICEEVWDADPGQLAIDAGCNAFAAPLGMLECGADTFAGQIPLILKVNSGNSLSRIKEAAAQTIHGSVQDALRLGCAAIGYTIYPASDAQYDMMTDLSELIAEAKSYGLASVVWSYPRGGKRA